MPHNPSSYWAKTSTAGSRLGGPVGTTRKARTGWSTGMVTVIAATALASTRSGGTGREYGGSPATGRSDPSGVRGDYCSVPPVVCL